MEYITIIIALSIAVVLIIVLNAISKSKQKTDKQGSIERITGICIQLKNGELKREHLALLAADEVCEYYKVSDKVRAVAKWFHDCYILREKPNGDVFFIGDLLPENEIKEYISALVIGSDKVKHDVLKYTKELYENECKLYIPEDN